MMAPSPKVALVQIFTASGCCHSLVQRRLDQVPRIVEQKTEHEDIKNSGKFVSPPNLPVFRSFIGLALNIGNRKLSAPTSRLSRRGNQERAITI